MYFKNKIVMQCNISNKTYVTFKLSDTGEITISLSFCVIIKQSQGGVHEDINRQVINTLSQSYPWYGRTFASIIGVTSAWQSRPQVLMLLCEEMVTSDNGNRGSFHNLQVSVCLQKDGRMQCRTKYSIGFTHFIVPHNLLLQNYTEASR